MPVTSTGKFRKKARVEQIDGDRKGRTGEALGVAFDYDGFNYTIVVWDDEQTPQPIKSRSLQEIARRNVTDR